MLNYAVPVLIAFQDVCTVPLCRNGCVKTSWRSDMQLKDRGVWVVWCCTFVANWYVNSANTQRHGVSYSHRVSDKQGRLAGVLLSSRQQGRVSVVFAYAGLGEFGITWDLLVCL